MEIEVHFSGALGKFAAAGTAGHRRQRPISHSSFRHYTSDRFSDDTIIELPGLFRDMREATLVYTRLIAAGALRGYEDFFVIGAFGVRAGKHPYQAAGRLRSPICRAGRSASTIRSYGRRAGKARHGAGPHAREFRLQCDQQRNHRRRRRAADDPVRVRRRSRRQQSLYAPHQRGCRSTRPDESQEVRKRCPPRRRTSSASTAANGAAARFVDILGRVNAPS